MSVESLLTNNKKTFTITIEGDFNFSLLHPFRSAYNNRDASAAENIVVDLRKTLTVDSSALGMLLNMQTDLNKKDNEIRIINCNEVVKKIFAITNFEKKFNVE